MKKLAFITALFFGITFHSSAQLEYDIMNGSTLILSEGLILVYGVDYHGTLYDFIITIKSLENETVEFDYEMTNAAGTKGKVKMSAEAINNATAQNNYFSGGTLELNNMTSVWLSKKVFNELTGVKGKSTISTDGGKSNTELIAQRVGYDYSLYNAISKTTFEDISYFYAESADASVKYWVHFSEHAPLILKMDLGWKIWLKEMKR